MTSFVFLSTILMVTRFVLSWIPKMASVPLACLLMALTASSICLSEAAFWSVSLSSSDDAESVFGFVSAA